MKAISAYIDERLKFTKGFKAVSYNYKPIDYNDLAHLLDVLLVKRGDDGDFNDIDTSAISDMTWLFDSDFCGDVSEWDVSNVTNMDSMFYGCRDFNCDISRWDVSNVKNMTHMFLDCKSFNQDLSKWDVSSCSKMTAMFNGCTAMEKLPNWYKAGR